MIPTVPPDPSDLGRKRLPGNEVVQDIDDLALQRPRS